MSTTTVPQLAPGHIGLNVTDLERSVGFYRRALGFEQLSINSDGQRLEVFAPSSAEAEPAPNGESPTCGFF